MPQSKLLSVIIPTYNPDRAIIGAALNALKVQTISAAEWDLIIVDNNSNNGVLDLLDISWHPNAVILKEPKQGLTYSRLCGFSYAQSDIVIMVDDDNILSPDYLQLVVSIFDDQPQIGALGGKIEGKFNGFKPEDWTKQFWGMLAIRDFGNKALISEAALSTDYPDCSPVGAGMAIRSQLLNAYIKVVMDSKKTITDRTAGSLSSGGDNEIVINVLNQGYAVAYFPQLNLQHLIPQSRLSANYLARLNYDSSKSWVKLLLRYNLSSYKKIPAYTVGLRKIKSWLTAKAYASQVNYIKWKGYCGMFDGLAESN